MIRKIIIPLMVLCFSNTTFSQTTINEGNVSGIWNKNNSPYKIEGNITIPTGMELKIEPGVRVEFNGRYQMKVDGTVNAIGSAEDSIVFIPTSNKISLGWNGIIYSSTPTSNDSSKFDYCVFRYSKVYGAGSVFNIANFSKIKITNSLFQNDSSITAQYTEKGGTVYCKNSNIIISGCAFIDNYTNSKGGAIVVDKSKPVISKNKFIGNKAQEGGGGAIYVSGSDIEIINSLFVNNTVPEDYTGYTPGGAIYSEESVKIINCTFFGNHSEQGGALYLDGVADTLINNIFLNNECSRSGYGDDIYAHRDSLFISNCNINVLNIRQYLATLSYGTNVYDSLCFTDYPNGNFGLNSNSLCVNSGKNAANRLSTDLAGNPRIYDDAYDIIDIGAYEFQGYPVPVYNVAVDKKNINYKYLNINSITIDSLVFTNTNFGDASILIRANDNISIDGITGDIRFVVKSYSDTVMHFKFKPSVLGNAEEQIEILNETKNDTINVNIKYIGTKLPVLYGLDITNDYKWTEDTIIIKDDISISQSGKLTIEKGAVLYFEDKIGINVNGTLNVYGNHSERVQFSAAEEFKDKGWDGINFYGDNTKRNSTIKFALIEYAKTDLKSKPGGAGMYINNYDSVVVSNTIISDNTSDEGGGIYVESGSNIILQNNLINNNYGRYGGSAIYINNSRIKIINNTICYNKGSMYGWGGECIYFTDCDLDVILFANNVLYGNYTGYGYNQMRMWGSYLSMGKLNIVNSILHTMIDESVVPPYLIEYTNSQFGDPFFLNIDMKDYRPHPTSIGINQGGQIPELDLGEYDLYGNTRVYENVVDIGAFEYQGNYAPALVKEINDTLVNEGFSKIEYKLSDLFIDYENDLINYKINVVDANVVSANLSDNNLVISEKNYGKTVVGISAWDDSNDTLSVDFNVIVNFVPKVKNPIDDMSISIDTSTIIIDLKDVFYDLDSESLVYDYETSNNSVVGIVFENDSIKIVPQKLGTVELTIKADDGHAVCMETFEIEIKTPVNTLTVKSLKLNIYPNPTTGKLFINIENSSIPEGYINIYDIYGVLVKTMKYEPVIDISFLKSGIYFVKLFGNKKYKGTFKILKL